MASVITGASEEIDFASGRSFSTRSSMESLVEKIDGTSTKSTSRI